MAKLLNGINGPFSGKVGTVVGYVWKGKAVMRGLPKERSGEPSLGQKQQHAKFKMMHAFFRMLVPFLNDTFSSVAVQMTGFNKAFSYNVKNAITGTYPDLKIDYSKVLVGKGDLQNVSSVDLDNSVVGELSFSWIYDKAMPSAFATDQVYIAIYCEEKENWIHVLNPAARKVGNCTIDTSVYQGKEVHTYFGFISNNGKDATNSLYTGMIQL
jgi:Family of unknown function (DUF6266)